MLTDRRTVIATGAALTTLIATGACSQEADSPTADPETGPSGLMEVIHIFAGEDGVSHVNRVKVTGSPKPLPAHSVVTTSIAQGTEDWHIAPAKTFTINVVGDIEGEVSDGTKVRIGKGDLVFLEDRTGKGHITRLLTPVANIFIRMEDDFDFLAWANAEPTKQSIWD
jgi:hypothetical protein